MPGPARRSRRTVLVAVLAVVVLAAGAVAAAVFLRPSSDQARPSPTPSVASPAPDESTPAPTPTPTGPAENTAAYDLAALPPVEVFALHPDLPVDDDPDGGTTGRTARAISPEGAPVFADPAGEPVAMLPQEQRYGGTTVPVVEEFDAWVRVLLVGRQAVPSAGDSGQLTGWLRTADVVLEDNPYRVEVDLTARTIDIVGDEGTERIATDFASGAEGSPTPTGRAFIMLTETVESLGYTRGHPIVYLSEQSPTLDGFDGQSVAVTAFHYHDVRSGAISNGCLRLDEAAITRLAQLPAGTPVLIRG